MPLNYGVGGDSWESLGLKEIQPVNPKGNQPLIFIGKTDTEAETPILWPPDAKSWLIRKDLDARKNWRQEEKGMTENKMVVWPYQLNGHSLSKLWEMLKYRKAWSVAVHGVTKNQTQLSDWTTTKLDHMTQWEITILSSGKFIDMECNDLILNGLTIFLTIQPPYLSAML